jgi:hypothetical protein
MVDPKASICCCKSRIEAGHSSLAEMKGIRKYKSFSNSPDFEDKVLSLAGNELMVVVVMVSPGTGAARDNILGFWAMIQ